MTRHGHGFMTRKGLAGDSSSRPPPGRAAPGLVGSGIFCLDRHNRPMTSLVGRQGSCPPVTVGSGRRTRRRVASSRTVAIKLEETALMRSKPWNDVAVMYVLSGWAGADRLIRIRPAYPAGATKHVQLAPIAGPFHSIRARAGLGGSDTVFSDSESKSPNITDLAASFRFPQKNVAGFRRIRFVDSGPQCSLLSQTRLPRSSFVRGIPTHGGIGAGGILRHL